VAAPSASNFLSSVIVNVYFDLHQSDRTSVLIHGGGSAVRPLGDRNQKQGQSVRSVLEP